MNHRGWTSRVLDATYALAEGSAGLERALDRLCDEASAAVADGVAVVVLSDRAAGPDRVAVSSSSLPAPCTTISCRRWNARAWR